MLTPCTLGPEAFTHTGHYQPARPGPDHFLSHGLHGHAEFLHCLPAAITQRASTRESGRQEQQGQEQERGTSTCVLCGLRATQQWSPLGRLSQAALRTCSRAAFAKQRRKWAGCEVASELSPRLRAHCLPRSPCKAVLQHIMPASCPHRELESGGHSWCIASLRASRLECRARTSTFRSSRTRG